MKNLAKRLFGYPRLVLSELASLAWIAVTSMFDIASLGVPSQIAAYLPAIGFILFLILVYRHIYQLQQQLNPKLDLVFGDYPACTHRFPYDNAEWILYRVGLKNLSGTTIEDVKVSLVNFEPQGITFGPVPLFVMNQIIVNQQYNLDPGDDPSVFVDVIQKPVEGENKDMMVFRYAKSDLRNTIQAGRYVITLLAQGKNVPSCRKNFCVDVDSEGNMTFEEVNE